MKVNPLNRMMVAVVCSAVLFVGRSMTTYAQQPQENPTGKQDAKQKENEKQKETKKQKPDSKKNLDKSHAQQPDPKQNQGKPHEQQALKWSGHRPDPHHQQQLIEQQQQRLAQYRQHLDQQQQVQQQFTVRLQQEKRNSQYRYQQYYSEQMLQQRRRYEDERDHDYQNDPFFLTAFDRRYSRGGTYYETNQYGEQYLQQAVQNGYSEGVRAGRADREDHWRSDYQGSFAYRDANYGYNGYYVSQDDYNYYFREGFRRGYYDGYNNGYRYGSHSNGKYAILGGVLAGILTFVSLR